MKQLHTYFSRFTFAFVLSLIVGLSASAQTYPVQTTVSTTAPYLNYLSYYGDQNNHLQIMVTNLDFNAPSLLVRLRIRIEGPGYELYTNPNAVIGQPFMLDAGMPLVISGIELLPYLQQSNLINPSNVDLNDLPHGFTTICVDVINESSQQQVLSTNNCGFIPIQEYQPPQAFVPSCGDQLDTNTMFHNFTWTPPVPFPAGAGLDLFYDFSIYHWIDPNNNSALGGNSILVYQENDLIAPTTQVSDFDIQWDMGGTYIWTVTARVESNGMPISLIENGGVSAPCTFVYGEELSLADQLTDGLEIELFTEPSAERKGKAWWTVTDNTPNQGLSTFDEFFVEYRKQPTGNEGFQIPWFSKTLTSFEHFIYQLEPSTTYEVKVSGVIAGVVGDPTPVKTFTTPDPRVYNCGDSDLPYLPSTFTPLENATAGTQVQIGQFMLTMTQVVDLGGGHYSGKGTIPIAFLGGAKAKVRFDDILIDTEYRVHNGRVDVITKGLENWLDEQYQQFIDPYYVDGTIDSAWVDTVNGVAWVTVDGEDQQFTFDPPHYPIIVNDENGNQYTIYPDGTIEVGTFLAISETWDIMPDEVIHFGQNDTETRGFDPKEHIQWHENYEVMMLADSSKYFVANKSLAKDEGDKVNVEIPAGVSASFEFADGTPVMASSLQGNWIGTPQHNGSTKMTLSIPARSSTGNYSIYAFANNQKVGQLNVKVYSKKERELVVVPIATTNLTASQIKAELDNTLGEANLDVDVEITPPWTDNTGTFTTSTTIAMPTEVGLLNKYSDDMRAIRDLYFEQNPNADKSKYYLFMVSGFDDPNELGYMVRGRAMGFVKANHQNVLNTIAHELGHGIGALEHTWKNNGPDKDSTSNLLDYGTFDGNLIREQWTELRDFDLLPSFFDGEEDGSFVQLDITQIPTNFRNDDLTYSFATPSGEVITLPTNLSSVTFSTYDPLYYQDPESAQATGDAVPIGALIEFELFDGSENIRFSYNQVGEVYRYKNKSYTFLSETNVSAGAANAPAFNDSTGEYQLELAYWSCYYDTLTKNRSSAKVILGFANYHSGDIGFNIHLAPRSVSDSEVRYSYLANSDAYFAIDFDRTDDPVSFAAEWESAGDYYANYFRSIVGTSVRITSGLKTSDLSPGAVEYLEKFSEWAAPDAITAPIVVAIAQWVTQVEALENHSLCVVNSLSPFSPLYQWHQQQQEIDFNPAIYPNVQEGGGPELEQLYLSLESEELFSGLWAYQKTFFEALNQIENGFDTEVEINSEMSVAQTVSEVKSVMNQYYSENLCSYWLISGENRLDAINTLKSVTNDDAALSDIIDLTITAKDNGQLYLMLDAFFSNNAQLYWTVVDKMTDGINHPRYNDFIHALLEMSILNNPDNTYDYSVGYNILDLTVNEYISSNTYSFRVETGGGNCIGGSCYEDTTIHCSPNDHVKINFFDINNNQLKDFYQDLGMSGKDLIVPAFYLAYLEYNRSFQNKMFSLNMLLDAVAIIASIPTGGASLSTIGAFTIGLSSANILVTVNEDAISEFGWGDDFLNLWQVVQVLDASNAVYAVGKGITKQTINGVTKLYFNADEIISSMESNLLSIRNDAKSAYHLTRDAFGYIKQASSTRANQFYNYIVQKLDGAFLKNYKTSIQGDNFDIDVLNSHNVVAISPSGQKNILTLENNSGGTFLKGEIDDVVENNATLMATIDNVRYRKNSSTQIDFGDLGVYKKADGNLSVVASEGTVIEALELKFAGKTNVLTWLSEISSNSDILAKLNDLPQSSGMTLDGDILSLKSYFNINPNLITYWNKFGASPLRLDVDYLNGISDFPNSWAIKYDGTNTTVERSNGILLATFKNDRVVAWGGSPSNWNQLLNKVPIKNHIYEVDTYVFETDALSRVKKVKATLVNTERGRNNYQQGISVQLKDGTQGVDDGGHLIANVLNGPGEQINYLPQIASLNRGDWKAMENTLVAALQNGSQVEIEIIPTFIGNSKRPIAFQVDYWINGVKKRKFFDN